MVPYCAKQLRAPRGLPANSLVAIRTGCAGIFLECRQKARVAAVRRVSRKKRPPHRSGRGGCQHHALPCLTCVTEFSLRAPLRQVGNHFPACGRGSVVGSLRRGDEYPHPGRYIADFTGTAGYVGVPFGEILNDPSNQPAAETANNRFHFRIRRMRLDPAESIWLLPGRLI